MINVYTCYIEPPPPQQQEQQQTNEIPSTSVVPTADLFPPLPPLAPISPRQEALGMMADKKRQKWMREKGKNYIETSLNHLSIF